MGSYYGRGQNPREILFEDRTKPHSDNVGNGWETTAAVGVLKAIHGESGPNVNLNANRNAFTSYLQNRIVKDVVCFHAQDYEKIVDFLKLDVYEPPVAQVN